MTMFYHHQSQMRDRERRRKESAERKREADKYSWTMNGPDPEGVEVPEYITIARNHLANRDRIVLPEKTKKEEPEGGNSIAVLAIAVIVLVEIALILVFWKL